MFHVASSGSGRADIIAGLKSYRLAWLLASQEIRQRYRRSFLGPFWITISMGVVIGSLGVVFSQVLNAPISTLLPYLSAGLIFWTFIQTTIIEGCASFTAAEALIKQGLIPLFVHVERVIFRNLLILAHNLVILPIVFVVCQYPVSLTILLCIPGLILLAVNIAWIVLMLAILSTRYRDIVQMISSALQVLFYLTPIIWLSDVLTTRSHFFLVETNPFFHLIHIVRAPLLDLIPEISTWLVVIILPIFGWLVTLLFFDKYRRRIAYWL